MISVFIVFSIKTFAFFIHIQPLFVKRFLGVVIGIIWFDLLRIRRTVAIKNILRVYPDMSQVQAKKLARKSLIHMGYTLVEFCSMPFLDESSVKSMFTVEGREKLETALKKNKGVLLLSAHIGNGDLATAALSYLGFQMCLVSKIFKVKWLNDFWFSSREKHGSRFIAPRRSSYEILKALKRNKIVVFILDQYTGPPNGIVTEFFGIKTGTAFGPALFAQRSNTEVLSAFSYRKKFGQHVIKVSDPIKYETVGSKDDLLRKNTQLFNSSIERMIKDKPEQWMWIHRRWKQAW